MSDDGDIIFEPRPPRGRPRSPWHRFVEKLSPWHVVVAVGVVMAGFFAIAHPEQAQQAASAVGSLIVLAWLVL